MAQWLEQDYHRRRHSGICETPLERYLRSLASIRRRRLLNRLGLAALHRGALERKATLDEEDIYRASDEL